MWLPMPSFPGGLTLSQWKKIVTLDKCDKIHLGGIVVLTLNWLFWWLQGYLLFSLVSKAASAVIDVTNYTCDKWHMWSIVPLTLRPGWFPRFEPSSRCVFPACCTASNTSEWVSEWVSECSRGFEWREDNRKSPRVHDLVFVAIVIKHHLFIKANSRNWEYLCCLYYDHNIYAIW